MVKKILSLTVAIMLLSVTAFATVTTPIALAQESEVVATVSVESSPTVDNNALTGSAQLKITAAANKEDVTVVTGVFSTEGDFLGAAVEEAFDLTAEVAEEKTIAMPTVSVTEDGKYVVNFYLWEKNTLAPLAGVTSTTVQPAAPAVWDGEAVTAAEDLQVATADDLGGAYTGYYMIKSGADLAGFANLVNGNAKDSEGNTVDANTSANAVLCNDIYLNYFPESDGSYDEEWYETEGNVEDAKPWTSYMMTGYAGTFDGGGNDIYGMYVSTNHSDGTGLFATLAGTVKNVNVLCGYIKTGISKENNANNAGMLAGATAAASVIQNVTTSGKITARASDTYMNASAGILGNNKYAGLSISNCTSYVDIILGIGGTTANTGTALATNVGVGGIVGLTSTSATIENCENYGDINMPYTNYVGGIIGAAKGGSSNKVYVTDCVNHGNITGYSTVGQIAGNIRYGSTTADLNADATMCKGTCVKTATT